VGESAGPFKSALLLAPLIAGLLALHAWGDAASQQVARRVDLWQFPEISRPPFVLRFPRGSEAERWAPGVLGQIPDEVLQSAAPLLDLRRPDGAVPVILLGPDFTPRRLAGPQAEALKENESLYDPERRTIIVRMGRSIEQGQVTAAIRRGVARLLLQEAGSAHWSPWLAEGLVGLLDRTKPVDARAAGEELPALNLLLTAREADFLGRDGALYTRGARLLVAWLRENSPREFAAYCRASQAEGQVHLSRFLERFANPPAEQTAWREWLQAQK
jgi:hypothetical protein